MYVCSPFGYISLFVEFSFFSSVKHIHIQYIHILRSYIWSSLPTKPNHPVRSPSRHVLLSTSAIFPWKWHGALRAPGTASPGAFSRDRAHAQKFPGFHKNETFGEWMSHHEIQPYKGINFRGGMKFRGGTQKLDEPNNRFQAAYQVISGISKASALLPPFFLSPRPWWCDCWAEANCVPWAVHKGRLLWLVPWPEGNIIPSMFV